MIFDPISFISHSLYLIFNINHPAKVVSNSFIWKKLIRSDNMSMGIIYLYYFLCETIIWYMFKGHFVDHN